MKKFQSFTTVIFLLSLFFISSCSDDDSGPSTKKVRYIYFPVSVNDGADANQAGFYRINTDDFQIERLAVNSVSNTTGVGSSSVIIFEYDNGIESKLWAKCEDGSLIPVPLPNPEAGYEKVEYSMPPNVSLSADGHHAAYFVNKIPDGATEMKDYMPSMVVLDCSQGLNYITVDLKQFLIDNFPDIDVEGGQAWGEYIVQNENGSKIWFSVRALNYSWSGQIRYGLVSWTKEDGLKLESQVLTGEVKIWGYNHLTKELLVTHLDTANGGITVAKNFDDGFLTYITLNKDNLSGPDQIAVKRSEMAIINETGIELFHPDNGNYLSTVITFDKIDPNSEYIHDDGQLITMSPDAQVIVFALTDNTQDRDRTLFMVNRDGTGLKILAQGYKMGIPVISDEFEVEQ